METKRTVIGGASSSSSVAVDDEDDENDDDKDDDDDDDEDGAIRTLGELLNLPAAELGQRRAVDGHREIDGQCRIRRWITGSRKEFDSGSDILLVL
mmetsp:Transcript_8537/g.17851  ORF Transcript_8537/g.17851 Transcript_8537/m.17851 type:complete len:96 (-) Transcript_8537:22-309(-)